MKLFSIYLPPSQYIKVFPVLFSLFFQVYT
jgi:hypothetical protein